MRVVIFNWSQETQSTTGKLDVDFFPTFLTEGTPYFRGYRFRIFYAKEMTVFLTCDDVTLGVKERSLPMSRLKAEEFSKVSPLFNGVKYYAPVAYSVIEGNQPGAIFVDNNVNPTVALVCGQSGFCYLAGNQDNERFNQSLPTLLFEEVGLRDIDLCLFPEAWGEKLDGILGDRVRKEYIRTFKFRPNLFSKNLDWQSKIPSDCHISRIDEELFEQIANHFNAGIRHLWPNRNLFLSKGLGYALIYRDEIASICWTAFVGAGACDISLMTDARYEGRGYASLTAAALIDNWVRKGYTPTWHCNPQNEPSNAIARKMGFFEHEDFPMYESP